jgi:two-component system, chemotaxis family, chemotaxis protein CheY
MALATTRRSFVAYRPARPPMMRQPDDGDGGRGGVDPSSSPLGPVSSGAARDRRGEDASVTAPSPTEHASADVLVVDDDADVRWTVAEILRSAGFSVAEAPDGEVALGLLSTERYRMVLLDMRMPKRDGVSLIEAAGVVPPVIVHSAYSLDSGDRQRLGSRVVDYLHKPVSPQKLLRAVEAVLGPPK